MPFHLSSSRSATTHCRGSKRISLLFHDMKGRLTVPVTSVLHSGTGECRRDQIRQATLKGRKGVWWPYVAIHYAPLCPQHTFSSLDFQMHHFCVILFLFLVYNCSFPIASVFMCFPLFSSVFHGFFLLFLIYHDLQYHPED